MSWTVTVDEWLQIGITFFVAAVICVWWLDKEINDGGFDE